MTHSTRAHGTDATVAVDNCAHADTVSEFDRALAEFKGAYARLARARRRLVQLKTQQNASTPPISALPAEILHEIFLHCLCTHTRRQAHIPFKCVDCDTEYHDVSNRDVGALARVCRAWRALVVGSPRLWAIVPANQGRADIERALRRARGGVPLFVQMDISKYAFCGADWREEALDSVWAVLERLQHVEDLTICWWPLAMEIPLKRFVSRDARRLRRLVVTTMTQPPIPHEAPAQVSFPFVLTLPCPALEILVLQGFSISNINPRVLPSLRELYLDARDQWAHLGDILALLVSLPLLTKLFLARDIVEGDLQFDGPQEAVRLPNLRCLVLLHAPTILLKYLELPACVDTTVSWSWSYDVDMEIHEMYDSVAHYLSRSTAPTEAVPVVIDTLSIGSSGGFDVVVTLEEHRRALPPAEPRVIRYAFDMKYEHDPNPIVELYRAITRLSIIRELKVLCNDDCRESKVLLNLNLIHRWAQMLESSPSVEAVRVEGEHPCSLFSFALRDHDPQVHNSPWPLPGLKKLSLRPKLFASYQDGTTLFANLLKKEYREGPLMTTLRISLEARQAAGLELEELEIEVEGNMPVDEDIFAELRHLVGQITLRFGKPYDLTSHSINLVEDKFCDEEQELSSLGSSWSEDLFEPSDSSDAIGTPPEQNGSADTQETRETEPSWHDEEEELDTGQLLAIPSVPEAASEGDDDEYSSADDESHDQALQAVLKLKMTHRRKLMSWLTNNANADGYFKDCRMPMPPMFTDIP